MNGTVSSGDDAPDGTVRLTAEDVVKSSYCGLLQISAPLPIATIVIAFPLRSRSHSLWLYFHLP
jgi:hypothetical protein